MKKLKSFAPLAVTVAFLLAPIAPAFAQLDTTPPAVPTPPADVAPPAPDLCPNIDGAQASVPSGMIVDGSGNCITPVPADTTPPVISAVVSLGVTTTAASISWVTNELATSTFEYGTTTSYGSSAPVGGGLAIGGTAALTGLSPTTTYYYCIHATDASNNTSSSCGQSFATAAPATPIAPVSTAGPVVSTVVVTGVASSTVTLNWTTDKLANATVFYGTTTDYGYVVSYDSTYALAHSVVLTALSANATYHYKIESTDGANHTTATPDTTFTTSPVSVQVSDTTPPVISGVANASVLSDTATIVWNTNELATSTLEYGTTSSYGLNATLGTSALLVHDATILNLAPNTMYYYCIHATDLSSNPSSSCGHSFTTSAAPLVPDTTPPVASLITVTSIGETSATVTWTTNEVANGHVEYGTTAGYDSTAGIDTDYTLTDSAALSGLAPNTLYHYSVRSKDPEGNETISSDNTFTTTAAVAVQSGNNTPVSNTTVAISSISTDSVGTDSATVTWTTDLPSSSQVEYGVNSFFGTTTTADTALATLHSVTINNLSPNTNYVFRVKSEPAGASGATASGDHEFTTLAEQTPTSTPAIITAVSASAISTTGATIAWTTDKNADSMVEYGITTEYIQSSNANFAMTTSHGITLADLAPDTTYHYRVKSVDADTDVTYSEDYMFTTSAPTIESGGAGGNTPAPISVPVSVLNLAVAQSDQTSATLTWNVASPTADSAQEYDIRYSTAPITDSNFANATGDDTTFATYEDLAVNGMARTFIVAGLTPATTYYFAFKSKYENSDWSALSNVPTATTSAENVSTSVPAQSGSGSSGNSSSGGSTSGGGGGIALFNSNAVSAPTETSVSGNDSQISFNWKNPTDAGYVRTLIVKKAGGYPIFATDGTTVYEGNGTTFTDIGLANGTTYYYSLYSYNRAREYSQPVRLSLVPTAGVMQIATIPDAPVRQFVRYSFIDPLVYGDQNIEVEHLQQLLVGQTHFYPQKLVTGYFGDYTKAAIMHFQKDVGLPVTGIADVQTAEALNNINPIDTAFALQPISTAFDTDLSFGSTNAEVEALQNFLTEQGLYTGELLPIFGPQTRKAVVAFQQKYGITPAQGYVGSKTRAQIQTLVAQGTVRQ